jgi:hypothetical protein
MLDSIKTEEQEQLPGAAPMVPENPPPPPSSTDNHNTASTSTAAAADAMASPSLAEDIDLDAPILLHPTTSQDNNNEDTTTSSGIIENISNSPSQVLAADSETTSDNGDGAVSGLAGMLLD